MSSPAPAAAPTTGAPAKAPPRTASPKKVPTTTATGAATNPPASPSPKKAAVPAAASTEGASTAVGPKRPAPSPKRAAAGGATSPTASPAKKLTKAPPETSGGEGTVTPAAAPAPAAVKAKLPPKPKLPVTSDSILTADPLPPFLPPVLPSTRAEVLASAVYPSPAPYPVPIYSLCHVRDVRDLPFDPTAPISSRTTSNVAAAAPIGTISVNRGTAEVTLNGGAEAAVKFSQVFVQRPLAAATGHDLTSAAASVPAQAAATDPAPVTTANTALPTPIEATPVRATTATMPNNTIIAPSTNVHSDSKQICRVLLGGALAALDPAAAIRDAVLYSQQQRDFKIRLQKERLIGLQKEKVDAEALAAKKKKEKETAAAAAAPPAATPATKSRPGSPARAAPKTTPATPSKPAADLPAEVSAPESEAASAVDPLSSLSLPSVWLEDPLLPQERPLLLAKNGAAPAHAIFVCDGDFSVSPIFATGGVGESVANANAATSSSASSSTPNAQVGVLFTRAVEEFLSLYHRDLLDGVGPSTATTAANTTSTSATVAISDAPQSTNIDNIPREPACTFTVAIGEIASSVTVQQGTEVTEFFSYSDGEEEHMQAHQSRRSESSYAYYNNGGKRHRQKQQSFMGNFGVASGGFQRLLDAERSFLFSDSSDSASEEERSAEEGVEGGDSSSTDSTSGGSTSDSSSGSESEAPEGERQQGSDNVFAFPHINTKADARAKRIDTTQEADSKTVRNSNTSQSRLPAASARQLPKRGRSAPFTSQPSRSFAVISKKAINIFKRRELVNPTPFGHRCYLRDVLESLPGHGNGSFGKGGGAVPSAAVNSQYTAGTSHSEALSAQAAANAFGISNQQLRGLKNVALPPSTTATSAQVSINPQLVETEYYTPENVLAAAAHTPNIHTLLKSYSTAGRDGMDEPPATLPLSDKQRGGSAKLLKDYDLTSGASSFAGPGSFASPSAVPGVPMDSKPACTGANMAATSWIPNPIKGGLGVVTIIGGSGRNSMVPPTTASTLPSSPAPTAAVAATLLSQPTPSAASTIPAPKAFITTVPHLTDAERLKNLYDEEAFEKEELAQMAAQQNIATASDKKKGKHAFAEVVLAAVAKERERSRSKSPKGASKDGAQNAGEPAIDNEPYDPSDDEASDRLDEFGYLSTRYGSTNYRKLLAANSAALPLPFNTSADKKVMLRGKMPESVRQYIETAAEVFRIGVLEKSVLGVNEHQSSKSGNESAGFVLSLVLKKKKLVTLPAPPPTEVSAPPPAKPPAPSAAGKLSKTAVKAPAPPPAPLPPAAPATITVIKEVTIGELNVIVLMPNSSKQTMLAGNSVKGSTAGSNTSAGISSGGITGAAVAEAATSLDAYVRALKGEEPMTSAQPIKAEEPIPTDETDNGEVVAVAEVKEAPSISSTSALAANNGGQAPSEIPINAASYSSAAFINSAFNSERTALMALLSNLYSATNTLAVPSGNEGTITLSSQHPIFGLRSVVVDIILSSCCMMVSSVGDRSEPTTAIVDSVEERKKDKKKPGDDVASATKLSKDDSSPTPTTADEGASTRERSSSKSPTRAKSILAAAITSGKIAAMAQEDKKLKSSASTSPPVVSSFALTIPHISIIAQVHNREAARLNYSCENYETLETVMATLPSSLSTKDSEHSKDKEVAANVLRLAALPLLQVKEAALTLQVARSARSAISRLHPSILAYSATTVGKAAAEERAAAVARLISGFLFNPIAVASRKGMLYDQAPYSSSRMASNLTSANQSANSSFSGLPSFTSKPLALLRSAIRSPTTSAAPPSLALKKASTTSSSKQQQQAVALFAPLLQFFSLDDLQQQLLTFDPMAILKRYNVSVVGGVSSAAAQHAVALATVAVGHNGILRRIEAAAAAIEAAKAPAATATSKATASPATSPAAAPSGKMSPRQKWLADKKAKEDEAAAAALGDKDGDKANKDRAKATSPPETVTSAIAALVDSLAIANSNPSASSKQKSSSAQATAALAEAKRRLSDPLVASASLPPTTIGLFLSQFAALQEEVVLLREQVRAQTAGLAEAAAIASTSPAVTAAVLAQQQQVAKLKATAATTVTAPAASVAGKAPASTPAGKAAATGNESPPAATSPSKATSPTKAAAGKKVAPSPPAASAGKKAPAAAADTVPDIVIDYARLKVPPTPAEVTFGARAAELYAQNCSLGAQCTSQHLQLLSLQQNNERLSTMVNMLMAERGQREETMKALLSQLETAKGEVEEMRLLGRHRMSAFARSLFESKRAMATALAASKNTRHFGVGVGGLDAKKGHHISAAAKRKKEQAEFLQQLKAEEGKTWSGRRLRPHEQKMLLAPNNDDFPITLRNVSSSAAFDTTIDGKKVTSNSTATASAIVTWDSIERLAAQLAAGGIPSIPSTAIGPVGSTATKITNRLTFFAAASAGSDNTLGADEYFTSTVPPASSSHPQHRQQPNVSASNSNGPTNSNTPAPTSRAPSTQSEGDLDWGEGDTETNKKATTKDPKDKSDKKEKRSSKDDKSSGSKEGTAEATTGRDKKVPEASPTASTSAATLQVGLLPTPQNTNIRPPPPSISVGSILYNLSASSAQQSKALSASEVVALMELKPTLSNYQTALFNFTIQRVESLAKRLEAELSKTNRVLTSVSGGKYGGGGGPDFSISIDRDLDGESLLFRERSEQALALRRGGLAALRSAQMNAKSGEYSALSASSAPTNNSHYDGRRNKHSAGDAMLTGIAGNKSTRRGLWRGEVKEVDAATDAATLLQQLQMQGAARGGDSALPQQPHSILKGTTAAQRAAVIVAKKESHWSSLPREDPRARRHRKQQQRLLMSDSNSNPYDSEDSNLTDISNFSVDSTRYDVHGPLDGQPNDATDPFNFHLWYDLDWNHSDPYGSFFKILSALRRQAAERQRVLNEQLGDGGGKGGFTAKYNAASSSSPLLFNSSIATAVPTTTTHSTRYDPSVKLSVITSFFDEYHRRFAEEILFGSERMDDCMLPQYSGGPRMLAFTDLAMLRKVALAVPIKPTSSSLEQMRRTAMESLLLLPENQDQKALASHDGKNLSTSEKTSPKSSFKRALSFSYSPDTIAKAEAEAKKFEDDEAKFLAELEAEEEKEREDKKKQPSDELLQDNSDEPQAKTAESVANDSVSIVGTTRKSSIAVAGDTEFHPVPAYLRTASNARVVSGHEEKEASDDEAAHQAMRKKNDHHARIADTKSSSGSPTGRKPKATTSLADLSTLVRGGISHRRELVQRFSDMVNPMLPDEAVPRVTDVSVEGVACDGGLLVASFNASGAVRVNVRWLRQSIYNQLGQGGSGVGGFSAPELVKSDEDYSLQSYLFSNNAAAATTATPPSAGGAIAISGSQGVQAKQSILTYTPTAEDVGCYIILEVTPISERFGTGMAVVARTAGPIIADTPSIPHGVLSFTPQGAAMLPRQPRSSVVITPSQNPTNKSCLVGDRLQVCFSVSGLPMDFTEQTSVSAAARSNAVNFNQDELLQEGMGSKVIVRWQRSSNNIDYTTFATEVLDLSTASANYRYFKDLLSGGLLPEDPHGNLNKRVVTTTSASPVGSPLVVGGSTANASIGATDGAGASAAFPSIFASLNASSAVNQPPIDSSLAASASGIGGFLKRKGALHTDPHAYNTLEHNQRTLTSYATALYQQQQQLLAHQHSSPAASQLGATGDPQSAILSTSTSNVQTSSNVFMAFLFAGPELATCFVRAELVPVRGVEVSVKRIQQLTYLRSLEREKEKQLAKMQESSALAEIDGLAAGSFSIPKRVTRRIRFAEELIQVFSEEARTANNSTNNNVTTSAASAGNYSGVYQGWSEASAAAGLSQSSFVGPSLCTTSVYINSAPTTEAVVLEMVAAGGWNGKLLSGPRSNVTTILAQEDTNSKVIDGKDAKESSKKLKAPSLNTPPKTPPPQPASAAGDTINDPLPLSALSAKVVESAATKLRTAMRSSLVHVDVNAAGLTVSFQDGTQVVAPWPNSASGKRKSSSSSSSPTSTGTSHLEAGLKIRSSELARDSGRANMPYYLHSTHLLSAPAQFVEGSATLAVSSGSGGVTATTSADATTASIMAGPQLHIPPLFPVMAADATNNALYTYGTSPEAMLFDNSHTMVTGGSRQQHQQPLSGASIPLTSPLGNEFDTKVLSPLSWAYNPYSLTTLATAATIPPPPSCSDRASTNIFLILPPTSILVGSTSGIGRSSGSRSDSSKKKNASFAAPSRKSDKDGDAVGDDKNSAASAETDDMVKSPRSRSRSSLGGKERSSSPSSSSKRDGWSVLKNALIKKNPAAADSNGLALPLYDQIAGLFDSQRCLSVEVVFNTRSDRDVFVTLFQCFSIIGSDRKCLERVLGQSVCSKVVYPTLSSMLTTDASRAGRTLSVGGLSNDSIISARSETPPLRSVDGGSSTANDKVKKVLEGVTVIEVTSNADSLEASRRSAAGGAVDPYGILLDAYEAAAERVARVVAISPYMERPGCTYGLLTMLTDNRSRAIL